MMMVDVKIKAGNALHDTRIEIDGELVKGCVSADLRMSVRERSLKLELLPRSIEADLKRCRLGITNLEEINAALRRLGYRVVEDEKGGDDG